MSLTTSEPLWSLYTPPPGRAPGSLAADCPAEVLTRLASGHGVGLVLGPYHVLERLGTGAMAHVYKAEHRLMKRLVALKVLHAAPEADLPPGVRLDAAVPPPFHREARAAGLLCHPNIVLLYDAAELAGLQLLVLEYVEGPDLGQLVASRGPLSIELACECVRQAALGLHFAHERGLVHADVKPSNLLIQGPESAPVVKLLDLGLARPHGDSMPSIGPVSAPRELAGTPDFMAPEVARGNAQADTRSDQYSLGCTFYYLLTGQAPFPGGTWLEKLMRHQLDAPTPVRQLRPEVPLEVAAVVERLMAPAPDDRYANAAQAAVELHEWLFRKRQGMADSQAARMTPVPGDWATLPDVEDEPDQASGGRQPPVGTSVQGVDTPRSPGTAASQRQVRKAHRRQRSFAWCLVGGAMAGLLAAWAVGQWLERHGWRPEGVGEVRHATVAAATAEHPFVLEREGKQFDSLASAVAAACDGDTVLVRGAGPYATGPLEVRGKGLTLRAAPGPRPCLELQTTAGSHFWQPLLDSDAALTLEGLLLRRAGGEASGTTPLVVGSGPLLCLRDCRIAVPGGTMPVLCRGCRRVELRGCVVSADALAVCAEVSDSESFQMELVSNDLRVASGGGAAVSLWTCGGRACGGRLVLEDNRVEAGRVLALTRWTGRLEVAARGNTLRWREALVSFVECGAEADWRRDLAWQGTGNHYDAGAGWVRVEGDVVAGGDGIVTASANR